MMKRKFTTAEKLLLVAPLALLLFPFLLVRSSPEEQLNAEVLELAGTDAIACGHSKIPQGYAHMDIQMQDCMKGAFRQKKGFWTQERKTWINMHTGEKGEYWQSYVSTPQGEVFTFTVPVEKGFLAPKIRRLRWLNPRLKTQYETEYLGSDNESGVKLRFAHGGTPF